VLRALQRADLRIVHRVVDSENRSPMRCIRFAIRDPVGLFQCGLRRRDGARTGARNVPDTPFIFVPGRSRGICRCALSPVPSTCDEDESRASATAVERAIQEQRNAVREETRKSALGPANWQERDIEAALDCFITIDAQGLCDRIQSGAEKTFGYARDEVLGKELAELIIPAGMRASHRRGLKHYHGTGRADTGQTLEISAMRKDESDFPVELAEVPIRLPDQTLFSAYIRDIRERRRAERTCWKRRALSVNSPRTSKRYLADRSIEERMPLYQPHIRGNMGP